MHTDFDFDPTNLKPVFKDFEYEGQKYRLREASEDADIQHSLAIMKDSKLKDAEGEVTTDTKLNFLKSKSLLVSLCLFKITLDGKEEPVNIETVRSFGKRFVKVMYQWIESHSNDKSVVEGSSDPKDVSTSKIGDTLT